MVETLFTGGVDPRSASEAPNSTKKILRQIEACWGQGEIVDDLVHKYVSWSTVGAGLNQFKDERICVAAGVLLGVTRVLKGPDVAQKFTADLERLVEYWKDRRDWPPLPPRNN
jgi:hypothetical protein